jgi:hypothetical protein
VEHADEADHGIDAVHQAGQRGGVEDVGFDHFGARQDAQVAGMGEPAGWHDQADAVTGEAFCDRGADKTTAANEEDLAGKGHGRSPG